MNFLFAIKLSQEFLQVSNIKSFFFNSNSFFFTQIRCPSPCSCYIGYHFACQRINLESNRKCANHLLVCWSPYKQNKMDCVSIIRLKTVRNQIVTFLLSAQLYFFHFIQKLSKFSRYVLWKIFQNFICHQINYLKNVICCYFEWSIIFLKKKFSSP